LALEKDSLVEDKEDLQRKIDLLRRQLEAFRDSGSTREGGDGNFVNIETEETKMELEYQLVQARERVENFELELASREKWVSKLENEMKEARRSIVEKEDKIRNLENEMVELQDTLDVSLEKARKEVHDLELELSKRDDKLFHFERQLHAANLFMIQAIVLSFRIRPVHHTQK